MLKNVLISSLVALVAAGLVLTFSSPKIGSNGVQGSVGPEGPVGPVGPVGPQGPAGPRGFSGSSGQSVTGLESLLSSLENLLTSFQNQPASKLGSVVGTDLPNPSCIGNLCTAVVEGTCQDATTTLARIDTPFPSASSTVVSAIISIDSAATSTFRINLATSTLDGYAPVVSNATTTGLINRITLTAKATTTLNTLSQDTDSRNDTGFGGRKFEVGPRSTTSVLDTLVLTAVGRGIITGANDDVFGVTSLGNIFACRYKVEFQALLP